MKYPYAALPKISENVNWKTFSEFELSFCGTERECGMQLVDADAVHARPVQGRF